MYKEDSLRFVQERLRHNHGSGLGRELHFRAPARVIRRFVAEMQKGEARTFERVDASVQVRCADGSLWITNDGDPKDIMLGTGESYRAEREDAMHVYALQPTLLEIEFEDDASTH